MATQSRTRATLEIVGEHSAETMQAFQALRKAVNEAGPLPSHIRELIVASNFATAGIQGGFMTHGKRALEAGASPEELRHAVLVTLGANAVVSRVAQALTWVEELSGK